MKKAVIHNSVDKLLGDAKSPLIQMVRHKYRSKIYKYHYLASTL